MLSLHIKCLYILYFFANSLISLLYLLGFSRNIISHGYFVSNIDITVLSIRSLLKKQLSKTKTLGFSILQLYIFYTLHIFNMI